MGGLLQAQSRELPGMPRRRPPSNLFKTPTKTALTEHFLLRADYIGNKEGAKKKLGAKAPWDM